MSKLETILEQLAAAVKPGATTQSIDDLAGELFQQYEIRPAFRGYKPKNFGGPEGYPANICVSIDNEVIHGLPSARRIEEGQVIKIDIGTLEYVVDPDHGLTVNYYDDGATTILVGHCSSAARRLVKATKEALEAGCGVAVAGNTTNDIARMISEVAKKHDVHVIHGFGGHGIGHQLHMEPHIPNELDGHPDVPLVAGMRLAIEPMFATNHGHTYTDKDLWTIKLRNGGLAAHFERTVTI